MERIKTSDQCDSSPSTLIRFNLANPENPGSKFADSKAIDFLIKLGMKGFSVAKRTIKTVDGKVHYGRYTDFSEYDDYIEHEGFFTKKKLYRRMIIEDSTDTDFTNILATLIVILGIAVGIGLTIIEDNVSVRTSIHVFTEK